MAKDKIEDSARFKLFDDPNEVDEDRSDEEDVDENDEDATALHPKFAKLTLENKLLETSGNYYKCKLSRRSWSSGEGIVVGSDPDYPEIIKLPTAAACGRAFDGDIVVVELKAPSNEYQLENESNYLGKGRVVGILERKCEDIYEERFICRVSDHNNRQMVPLAGAAIKFSIVSPFVRFPAKGKVYQYFRKKANKHDQVKIYSPKELDLEKQNNYGSMVSQLFSVRYMGWSKRYWYPRGYVEKSFDALNLKRYLLQFQIPGRHSEKTQNHAEKFLKTTLPQLKNDPTREDLTELYVFTIDDENAKCLDDALSIERCKKHSNCWKVGVHITDVGSVVSEESEYEKEAKVRLMSAEGLTNDDEEDEDFDETYGKMLPHVFVERCSLDTDKKRLAISTFFHSQDPPLCIYSALKSEPKNYKCLNDYHPIMSVIKPKRKLSYRRAQELINKRNAEVYDEPTDENISEQLYHLWNVMWQFRLNRLGQAAYFIHNLGFNEGDHLPDQVMARILVEEAMITSNAFTASYLKYKNVPFLARSQLSPTIRNMNLVSLLALSPYQESFYYFYKSLQPNYQKELKRTMNDPEKMIVSKDVWQKIREILGQESMEVAVFLACSDRLHPELGASYSEFSSVQQKHRIRVSNAGENPNLSHFLLRVSLYTQCSSPLRRYVDLDTQRRLIRCLTDGRQPDIYDDICQKFCNREEELEKFKHCLTVHKTYASDPSKTNYAEGFVLEFNEFLIRVFFPNFSIVGEISIPLNELGPSKRFGDEKLEWKIRCYDLAAQMRTNQPGRICARNSLLETVFEKRSAVKTFRWNKFVDCLKADSFSENNQHKRLIKRVYESLTDEEEGKHEIAGCLRTSNGIFHGRNIAVEVTAKDRALRDRDQTLGTSLHFQFGLGLEQGIQAVVPQFMFLNRVEDEGAVGLEICMLHRRHVTVFEVDCEEITLNEDDFEDLRRKARMYKYYKQWLPLVMMDGIYSSVHDGESITLQLGQISFDEDTGVGQFTLGRRFCENCFLEIKRRDFLCIRKRTSTEDKLTISAAHGVVIEVVSNDENPSNVYRFKVFSTPFNDLFELGQDEVLSCEIIPLSISHRRMMNTLSRLPNTSPLVEVICVGNSKDISRMNDKPPPHIVNAIQRVFTNGHPPGKLGNFPHQLNEEQLIQIQRALESPFTLIQGPPGTGKSYMGAHLAYYFKQLNRRLSKRGKILYCGPSNKSVDVVAEYLKNAPYIKFTRVYGGVIEELDYPIPIKPQLADREKLGRVPRSLEAYALHRVIRQTGQPFAEQLRNFDNKFLHHALTVTLDDYKSYKKVLLDAKTQYLKQMDVILCTCSVAGGFLLSGLQLEFSQCIIDECGMCSEPETLIPIMTATNNTPNPQIVLIGDHKQLEPVITCRTAAKEGLKKSMFERLQIYADKLTRQYRMHENICDFSSKRFYGGHLETDSSVLDRDERNNVLLVGNNPALFCNVDGEEEEDESKSKFNDHQVKVVKKLLDYLLVEKQVSPNSVMVLSPYLAQCKKIKQAVEKLGRNVTYKNKIKLESVHVGSVITSQGSEADYVILSTVRSSACSDSYLSVDQLWLYKRIGFVTDDHQINVAITRAKLGLVIIGNRRLLEHYETWRSLIQSYRDRKAIKEKDELYHLLGLTDQDE